MARAQEDPADALAKARKAMEYGRNSEKIRKAVAEAPPLSREQIEELAVLLPPPREQLPAHGEESAQVSDSE